MKRKIAFTFHTYRDPDISDWGVLECKELGIAVAIEAGATQGHVEAVIGDMLSGYLQAAKNRGTLLQVIRQLIRDGRVS